MRRLFVIFVVLSVILAGLFIMSQSAVSDNDMDGDDIPDPVDDCPERPEDKDNHDDDDGCPENDRDEDLVYDRHDECPDEAEDLDGIKDGDGCPEDDADDDSVDDENDDCPTRPEDIDGVEDEDGCPETDADGDQIPDGKDLCPERPEDYDQMTPPNYDGCPEIDLDGDDEPNVVDPDDDSDDIPDSRDSDDDNDGVPDERDDCPKIPEDKDGVRDDDGCPEGDWDDDEIPPHKDEDADDDDIPDMMDDCPRTPEDRDGVQDGDGCPEDDDAEDDGDDSFYSSGGANPGQALRQGSSRAEKISRTVESPTMGERIGSWRKDVEEKYNPAVDDGDVPGFVSNALERRMLVRAEGDAGGDTVGTPIGEEGDSGTQSEEDGTMDDNVRPSGSGIGGVPDEQLVLEPTYIVGMDELTNADGEIVESVVENWGSGNAYEDGELSAPTVLEAGENYRDTMAELGETTQTTCMNDGETFTTTVADCNRAGGASVGLCATPTSEVSAEATEETPEVDDLDEIEGDKDDSDLTDKEKELEKEVKKKKVDEKEYIEELNDCEDFAFGTGMNLLRKGYDAGIKAFFYNTPNGTAGHAIVIVAMDTDGDGSKESVYVEPQSGEIVELNESKIKKQRHHFGEATMKKFWREQTMLERSDDDDEESDSASSSSVEEAVGNIAATTNPNGKVTSIESLTGNELSEFGQQVTITTDVDTVENIRTSHRPAEVARAALKHDEIKMKGNNIGASVKAEFGTRVGRITAPGGPAAIYGEENLRQSALGYQYIDTDLTGSESFTMGEQTDTSFVVDPNNGGREGFTTEGGQDLIQAGGTERLSRNAGVYDVRGIEQNTRQGVR